MKTKEAIELINTIDDWFEKYYTKEDYLEGLIPKETLQMAYDIHKVKSLLKRGEKFEAMWETLLEDLDFRPNKEKLHMSWEDFNNLMIKIEQRFFPKEKQCKN